MTHRTFYIVRHGETDWNAVGRWQGQTDIPLNDLGQRQATALGDYLRNLPIDRAISSDLSRAYRTAQLATVTHGLLIESDPRWREFNAGVLEGKTWQEMNIQYPEVIAGMHADWYGHTFPGGESRRQLQERAATAFDELLADGRGNHVAIFTHGTTVRVLLAHLFPDQFTPPNSHPSVPNTSIMVIQAKDGHLSLVAAPHTPHL